MTGCHPARSTSGRLIARALGLAFVALSAIAPTATADRGPSPTTFAEIVARSRLIVVVTVVRLDDALTVLRVDEVFKGSPPPVLTFPSSPTNVELQLGERALLSFVNDDLDFRAETIAWEIAADGALDPGHLNPARGMPPTLEALRGAFGVAAPSASGGDPTTAPPAAGSPAGQVPGAAGSAGGSDAPLVIATAAIVGIGFGAAMLALTRRRRASGH